jgi:hypothetical protein
MGGMYCYGNYGKPMLDCYNTGNFTVSENTEIGKGAYIGGMIGYFDATSATYPYTNCYNSGNISFKGKAGLSTEEVPDTNYNTEYTICLGGLAGQVRNNATTKPGNLNVTNGFKNSGKIEFSGSNPAGPVFIGGIVGDMARDTAAWTGDIVNTGDIVFTGSSKSDSYAGGIFGRTTVAIPNGVSYCTLNAQNCAGSGLITGSPRSATVTAPNCKVGGSTLAFDPGDFQYRPTEINEDNFYNFIFGGTTDWTGVENFDGATLLTEAPSLTPTTPAE